MEEKKMSDAEKFRMIVNDIEKVLTLADLEDNEFSGECYINKVIKKVDEFESFCKDVKFEDSFTCYLLLEFIAMNAIKAVVCLNVKAMGNRDYTVIEDECFKVITDEMADTFVRKNHDYGNSFDKSLDKFGLVAAACRMGDKRNRIESLMNSDAMVKDESVRDTLMDLANYSVMAIMWIDKINEAVLTDYARSWKFDKRDARLP